MSDVAADTKEVLAADTTDVFSAAKAADGGSCPASIQDGIGLIGPHMVTHGILTSSLSGKFRVDAKYGPPRAPWTTRQSHAFGSIFQKVGDHSRKRSQKQKV